MAHYAKIEDGTVVNVIVSDHPIDGYDTPVNEFVSKGFRLVDGEFQPPAVEEKIKKIDPLELSLTAAEFEAGLIYLDVDTNQIEPAIIQAITDRFEQANAIARWRRLVRIYRNNEVMGLVQAVFGITDAQIDDMWRKMVAARPQ